MSSRVKGLKIQTPTLTLAYPSVAMAWLTAGKPQNRATNQAKPKPTNQAMALLALKPNSCGSKLLRAAQAAAYDSQLPFQDWISLWLSPGTLMPLVVVLCTYVTISNHFIILSPIQTCWSHIEVMLKSCWSRVSQCLLIWLGLCILIHVINVISPFPSHNLPLTFTII